MAYTASGLTADQVQQADEDRTKRVFIGFLSSALGVDQTYSTDDMDPSQQSGQYIIANPDGTYSNVGRSSSNLNNASANANAIPPWLLLVGAFFLFKMIKG